MLFLVKRHWLSGLMTLLTFTALGLSLRALLPDVPPLTVSGRTVAIGLGVFAMLACSDMLIHGLLLVLFGERYRQRYLALAHTFREQTLSALVMGALLAGVGEELIFRGLSLQPAYLAGSAVIFGLLHHISRSLWPFTIWSMYQGGLLAVVLWWQQDLGVTMIAHALHDLFGFTLFRWLNARSEPAGYNS